MHAPVEGLRSFRSSISLSVCFDCVIAVVVVGLFDLNSLELVCFSSFDYFLLSTHRLIVGDLSRFFSLSFSLSGGFMGLAIFNRYSFMRVPLRVFYSAYTASECFSILAYFSMSSVLLVGWICSKPPILFVSYSSRYFCAFSTSTSLSSPLSILRLPVSSLKLLYSFVLV